MCIDRSFININMLRKVIVVSIFIAARSLPTDYMHARLHPKDAHPQLERESERVEHKMGGLLLDKERRHGECSKPAPDNKCPPTTENCNHFYILEDKNGELEPVMCRNPSGLCGKPFEPSWHAQREELFVRGVVMLRGALYHSECILAAPPPTMPLPPPPDRESCVLA